MKTKIILKNICCLLIFFYNFTSMSAQPFAPVINIVVPDYGLNTMYVKGIRFGSNTGGVIEWQRKPAANPIWPSNWESAGTFTGTDFEFEDSNPNQDILYDYRVREVENGLPSTPSNIVSNNLSVFWPLCTNFDCTGQATIGDLKSLIVGFNQPRGYSSMESAELDEIHESIDINGNPFVANEAIYSAVGGILVSITSDIWGNGIFQSNVVVQIRYNGNPRFISMNHLSWILVDNLNGISIGESISPGAPIGTINPLIWNTINSHIDYNYGNQTTNPGPIDIFYDPFLLFNEHSTDQKYDDPQDIAPMLNNLDGDVDGTTLSFKQNDDHSVVFDSKIHGAIDIIAEVADLQSVENQSGQVVKKLGYSINSLVNPGLNDVNYADNPFVLIDNEQGSVPTPYINRLIENTADKNAVMPDYHQDIGIGVIPAINYHLNFNYILTNTRDNIGNKLSLNDDVCWVTNVRKPIGPLRNGYSPGYLEARNPLEAHFVDGNYMVNTFMEDYQHSEVSSQEITVDNFAPFIKKVSVISGVNDVAERYWEVIPDGDPNYHVNGPLRFKTEKSHIADGKEQLVITAVTSEPIIGGLDLNLTNQDELGTPVYTISGEGRLHTYTFIKSNVIAATSNPDFQTLQHFTFSHADNTLSDLDKIQSMHNSNGGIANPGPQNPDQVFIHGRTMGLVGPNLQPIATNNNPFPPAGTGVGVDQSHYIEFTNCGPEFTGGDDNSRASGTCLVPSFSYEIIDGFTVEFTDESIGEISNWFWDFEIDSSPEQDPGAIDFGSAGTYLISLTIYDDCGGEETYSTEITLGGTALTAYINGPLTGEIGEAISFLEIPLVELHHILMVGILVQVHLLWINPNKIPSLPTVLQAAKMLHLPSRMQTIKRSPHHIP